MAEDGKYRIEKFDGQDFGWWKMQIEDLLCQKDLEIALKENKPTGMKDEDWHSLDRKALAVIRFTLAKNVVFNIVKETTSFGLMKALSNMYEKPSASNKVFLIRQLVNTKMKEGASVTSHVNNFNTILSRLLSVDIKFDDEIQALLLLSSLPDSWSGSVTAISSSSGTAKLTFEGIRDFILNEDMRRRNSGGESSGNLLNTEGRGRRKDRGNNRGRSKSRNRGRSKPRKDINCWNCKENGHFRSQCPNPPIVRDQKQVNITSEDSDDALICCIEDTAESRVMDSGASFHATPTSKNMKNLRTGNFGKVRLANNHTLDITGIGDIELRTSLGTTWILKDVRVIPGLKKMLISVGQLDDQGYDVVFGGGQWKVVKGSLVIAKGKKRGTLYMVEVPAEEANAVTAKPSLSKLWHQRLGHIGDKGMKMLVAKGKLPELKKVEPEFCESCVFGKKKKVSFVKTGKPPKAQKLELVHTDVYGPTSVSSLGGSNYYVTFIDDSTRKIPETENIEKSTHGFTRDGIPGVENVTRIDVVGGVVLQKVSANRSYFRSIANMDIKLDFVPPAIINFISRQIIGSGFKLYKKKVASVTKGDVDFSKALKDPFYGNIREALYSENKFSNGILEQKEIKIDDGVLEQNEIKIDDGVLEQETVNIGPPEEHFTTKTETEDENQLPIEDENQLPVNEIEEVEEAYISCEDNDDEDDNNNNNIISDELYVDGNKEIVINPEVNQALGTLEKVISIFREFRFSTRSLSLSRSVNNMFTDLEDDKSNGHKHLVNELTMRNSQESKDSLLIHTSWHKVHEAVLAENGDINRELIKNMDESSLTQKKVKKQRFCCLSFTSGRLNS